MNRHDKTVGNGCCESVHRLRLKNRCDYHTLLLGSHNLSVIKFCPFLSYSKRGYGQGRACLRQMFGGVDVSVKLVIHDRLLVLLL